MEICLSKSLSIWQLPRRISNAGMLSKAKKNYSQIEKGGLAIIFTVKKFHQFIYRRHFMIQTDHKSLLGFLAENEPIPAMTSARIQRWAIILFGYDYTLSYRSDHQNSNADCMSRLTFNLERETKFSAMVKYVFLTELEHAQITSKEVAYFTNHDPVLSNVYIII